MPNSKASESVNQVRPISIAWDFDVKSMFFTMCLGSLVVRALERYSKDPGSSPGGDTCFSLQ